MMCKFRIGVVIYNILKWQVKTQKLISLKIHVYFFINILHLFIFPLSFCTQIISGNQREYLLLVVMTHQFTPLQPYSPLRYYTNTPTLCLMAFALAAYSGLKAIFPGSSKERFFTFFISLYKNSQLQVPSCHPSKISMLPPPASYFHHLIWFTL